MEIRAPGCCLCAGNFPHSDFDSSNEDVPSTDIYVLTDYKAYPVMDYEEIETQIHASWRGLFFEIGKIAFMLPQTAARICRDMGPERLNLIHKATIECHGILPYVPHVYSQVCSNIPEVNWSLPEDMALINNYLSIVQEGHHSDQVSMNELAHGDEGQRRARLRLKTLQEQPYIFNAQIMRLACIYCRTRENAITSAINTGLPLLQDGLESAEELLLNMTIRSLTVDWQSNEPFNPRNFGEHEQAKRLARIAQEFPRGLTWSSVHELDAFLLSTNEWHRFFSIFNPPGSPDFNILAWLVELTNEEDWLFTAPTHELESRVRKIRSLCISCSALELQ